MIETRTTPSIPGALVAVLITLAATSCGPPKEREERWPEPVDHTEAAAPTAPAEHASDGGSYLALARIPVPAGAPAPALIETITAGSTDAEVAFTQDGESLVVEVNGATLDSVTSVLKVLPEEAELVAARELVGWLPPATSDEPAAETGARAYVREDVASLDDWRRHLPSRARALTAGGLRITALHQLVGARSLLLAISGPAPEALDQKLRSPDYQRQARQAGVTAPPTIWAVNGQQTPANGHRPTVNGQRSTANGQRPTADGQRPAPSAP